jgi:pimeloyl-ACP methyl ester carboxylesterase
MSNVMRTLGLAALALTSSLAAQTAEIGPSPGTMVDVAGQRVHLLCSGQGTPTVVLEAGASSFAIDWTLVQREVARTNRVCSYDRLGMGWSDSARAGGSEHRTLNGLLRASGERGPFIMVGASRGGLLARDYALAYPADVAGFVFVDASTEDRLFTMVRGNAVAIAETSADDIRASLPTRSVPVPKRRAQTGAPFDKLPAELYQQRVKLDERLIASTPDSVTPEFIFAFQDGERQLLARLAASRASGTPLGDRPTVVLTRGDEQNAGREGSHLALAKLSTNWRHSVIAGAGHEIHLFQPDAVVQAIADVVESVRTKGRLPPR